MNQTDYKEIAGMIKKNSVSDDTFVPLSFIQDLADYFEKADTYTAGFEKDNPNKFNKHQFLKDCGVE